MKKSLRLSNNRMIFGLCGGLGEYFAIDPVWLRLAFAAAFFFRGAGLGVYLVASLVVYLSSNKG
ncbi:TPA: PspC domain-containing protein [Streptococcus suis]